MILLSKTKTHSYWAVEVPKGSFNYILHDGLKKESFLSFSTLNSILLTEAVGHLKKPIILGVIGPEDIIPEEVLNELGYNTLTVDGKIFPHPSEAFQFNLIQKGILIENPIEKPEPPEYDANSPLYKQWERYNELLEEWQSYEQELKKVVIIKTEN